MSNTSPAHTRGPLLPSEVTALAKRCRDRGDTTVAAEIGLDRLTIARAALGMPVTRGCREILSRYLAEVSR